MKEMVPASTIFFVNYLLYYKMTEKTTDIIISKLLDASNIKHYAESCPIEEINKAMVSKRGTGKKGFQNTWQYRVTLLL